MASFLPDDIPYKPVWDPQDDHDPSLDDTTSPLTTCWAYAAHSWFPLVPLNPGFDSPIFECLNHSMFSLHTEVDSQRKYILHHDIRESWHELEKKLPGAFGSWTPNSMGHCTSTSFCSVWVPKVTLRHEAH
ncbi:hypothetical protein DFH29DRAFT_1007858 [Suillus ampliporus]|nr:hypothetical protein DFH29DRAFT_1007858 [Suillus ampliporus]